MATRILSTPKSRILPTAQRGSLGRALTSTLLIVMISAVPSIVASAAQAYAPKAQLPAGADPNSITAMMLQDAEVPSGDEVGVPAYPGAQVVQVMRMPNLLTQEESGNVRLITSDPPESVVAWYKESLAGWSSKEDWDITAFGEGGRAFHPMTPNTWGVVPNVTVAANTIYGDVWPAAKTMIEINYPLTRSAVQLR